MATKPGTARQAAKPAERLARHQLGRLTPAEQPDRYRTAHTAYTEGTGSLDAVREAVTPAVAELLSLQEQAAARRRREAAEAETRAAEAETRAAAGGAFWYDVRTFTGALAFAVMAVVFTGLIVTGPRYLHEHMPHRLPRPADSYSVVSFAGPGTLTTCTRRSCDAGSSTRRVLRVIERQEGGTRYLTWWPADRSRPQNTDGVWTFFPDDPSTGAITSSGHP